VPSPVAHFLAGLVTHAGTSPSPDMGLRRRTVITVAAAVAPDLDFAFVPFGLAVHQGASHSVGAALLAGAAVAAFAAILRCPRAVALGLAAFLGWSSHVVLDMLNLDTHPPIGVLALWPLGEGYYKVPWPIFMDIGRTLEWTTVRHNALALAWEAALLCPLLAVIWRARTARGR
jgi:membrane-bound metal-dependent hydrolase YbcI (DUF457 family)